MGRLLRIVTHVIQGLFITLITVGAFVFTAGKLGFLNPLSAYIILSGSMEPTIPVGSIVISEKSLHYGVGDIISFSPSGSAKDVITHRIASVAEKGDAYFGDATYTTKGDSNKAEDRGEVKQSAVLGNVVLTLPYIGYAAHFAKTPQGFILLIVIPATIIVYEELKALRRELAVILSRAIAYLRKKITKNTDDPLIDSGNPSYSRNLFSTPRMTSIPFSKVIVVIVVLMASLAVTVAARSFYFDQDTSVQNVIGVSTVFTIPTPTPTPIPIAQTLVISEFLWNSGCTPNPEQIFWIELFNGSASQENLKDWQFTDSDGTVIQISNADHLLDPGEYILISKSTSTFTSGCYTNQGGVDVLNLGGNPDFSPSGTGGVIKLEKPNNLSFDVIDRVEYGPTLNSGNLDTSTDESIARTPNGIDTALGDTFAASDFQVKSSPSPGVATP